MEQKQLEYEINSSLKDVKDCVFKIDGFTCFDARFEVLNQDGKKLRHVLCKDELVPVNAVIYAKVLESEQEMSFVCCISHGYMKVDISSEGYFIARSEFFETLHSALVECSESYFANFNQILFNKINSLSNA